MSGCAVPRVPAGGGSRHSLGLCHCLHHWHHEPIRTQIERPADGCRVIRRWTRTSALAPPAFVARRSDPRLLGARRAPCRARAHRSPPPPAAPPPCRYRSSQSRRAAVYMPAGGDRSVAQRSPARHAPRQPRRSAVGPGAVAARAGAAAAARGSAAAAARYIAEPRTPPSARRELGAGAAAARSLSGGAARTSARARARVAALARTSRPWLHHIVYLIHSSQHCATRGPPSQVKVNVHALARAGVGWVCRSHVEGGAGRAGPFPSIDSDLIFD